MKTSGTIKQFLVKHRERVVLIAMGVGFVMFVMIGIYLQRQNHDGKTDPVEAQPEKIELKVPENKSETNTGTPGNNASYFLKPSPQELLDQLTSMENLNEDVVDKKFTGFRVLWPLYFFSVTDEGAGQHSALFDVSEDGFGTLVKVNVDVKAYPEVLDFPQGTAVWVGGEIAAVDLAGTGTIYIKLEQLSKDKGDLVHQSEEQAPQPEQPPPE